MLDEQQLADHIDIPIETLAAWRRLQTGPPAITVAGRPYYLEVDLAWWRADHPTTGGPDTISSPPSSAIDQVSIGKSRAVNSAA